MDAFIHVGLDLQRICVDWDMLIIYWAIEHNNIFQKVLPLRLLGCLTLCTKVPFCSTLPLSLSLYFYSSDRAPKHPLRSDPIYGDFFCPDVVIFAGLVASLLPSYPNPPKVRTFLGTHCQACDGVEKDLMKLAG